MSNYTYRACEWALKNGHETDNFLPEIWNFWAHGYELSVRGDTRIQPQSISLTHSDHMEIRFTPQDTGIVIGHADWRIARVLGNLQHQVLPVERFRSLVCGSLLGFWTTYAHVDMEAPVLWNSLLDALYNEDALLKAA